jgi:leucyl-tRNA synthetase
MDKKKSELYFSAAVKKFLTEKRNGASRKCSKSFVRTVDLMDAVGTFGADNSRCFD